MMINLDEEIKHCEEIVNDMENREGYAFIAITYAEYASEYRQLAEWLRELKDYKDARVGCEYCKHKFREQHERPCSLCQRNFVDKFEREVNADEDKT